MGLNAHILTITEPTIVVDKIEAPDMGQREAGGSNFDSGADQVPYIKINGYVFQTDEIDRFNLKLTGKYPEISATLVDSRDIFTVAQFPRDGDVLSLRLKVRGDKYKDIRMDFHIIEFRGIPTSNVDKAAGGARFNVRAFAKLPGFYTDECKSYGKASSYDHLIKIAEDLKLGFATNVDATDDQMTRLCAYQSKFELLEDTVLHSYISDDTFQTYSIDPYYYVNFVDVQKLFNAEEDIEMAELRTRGIFNERPGDSKAGDEGTEMKLLLTNNLNAGGTANFIESYNLINNSTAVALENGYKRNMQYYDMNSEMTKNDENLSEFFVESLVSSTIKDNEEPLKGRRNSSTDEYATHAKHKYLGIQDSNPLDGNVHLNWGYSAINNIQNLVELDKMKLVVTLTTINPAVYRYMKIPVTIFNYSQTSNALTKGVNKKATEDGFETKEDALSKDSSTKTVEESTVVSQPKIDEFLTGYYVVMGVEYTYDITGSKKQILHLSRKEWPARINNI